jgi:hypothetical protein
MSSATTRQSRLEPVASLLFKSAGCALIGATLAVYLIVLLGTDPLSYIARWSGLVVTVILLAALVTRLIATISHRRFGTLASAVTGVILGVAGVAVFVILVLPPAP